MEDSEDQPRRRSVQEHLKTPRKAKKRGAGRARRGRKETEFAALDETTDSDPKETKLREWRDTRTAASLARNWKLLHYLGFEPARRKRSLAQIESYDDLELALMRGDPRSARDLRQEEENVEVAERSSQIHERARRSPGLVYNPAVHAERRRRSTDIMGTYHENILGSLEDVGISVNVPGLQEPSEGERTRTVANLTLGGHTGTLRIRQNASVLTDSALEEALRRPAAAVRALVGPVVGRARAALLRLRLTEAARAEQQEAALVAAEAAEHQLRLLQAEASRRSEARQAAERRLWQLLDQTEAVARSGGEAQREARREVARRSAAETRLEAERSRRRQMRQIEAEAAASHSAVRARLLRRVQTARQQAAAQSRALTEARRQADGAEERARQAETERRQERRQLRRLEASERQKLVELQRHGAERLAAALREAEAEERRAQEAEHSWRRAEHQARPQPEPPPPEPPLPRQRHVKTGLRVRV